MRAIPVIALALCLFVGLAAAASTKTIVGTPRNDTIVGTPGDDTISGLAGNENINGRGGFDRIFGGIGNDKLDGYTGRDSLYGGPGTWEYLAILEYPDLEAAFRVLGKIATLEVFETETYPAEDVKLFLKALV